MSAITPRRKKPRSPPLTQRMSVRRAPRAFRRWALATSFPSPKKCSPASNSISRHTGRASVGWISDGSTRSRRSSWSGTEIQTPSTSRNAIASARQPPLSTRPRSNCGARGCRGRGPEMADARRWKAPASRLRINTERRGLEMLHQHAQFEDGSVSVEAGIADMLIRMEGGRFKVLKHLNEWFEEFRLYHRKDGRVHKEGDDLMSATRYAMMMLRYAETSRPKRPLWSDRDQGSWLTM